MNSRNQLGTKKQSRTRVSKASSSSSATSSTSTTASSSLENSSSSSPSPPMPSRKWNFVQVSGSKKTRGKRKRPVYSTFMRDWIIESARAPATPITSITTTVITTSLADPNAPLPEDLLCPPTPPSMQRSGGRTCGASLHSSRRARMLHSLEPRTWTPAELQWFVMSDSPPKRTTRIPTTSTSSSTTISPSSSSNSPPSSELSFSEPMLLPPSILNQSQCSSSIDFSATFQPPLQIYQYQNQPPPLPASASTNVQIGSVSSNASFTTNIFDSSSGVSTRLLPAISTSHIYDETLAPAFPSTPLFSASFVPAFSSSSHLSSAQQSTMLQNLLLFGEEFQDNNSSE